MEPEDEDEGFEAGADEGFDEELGEASNPGPLVGKPILEDMAGGFEKFRPGELTIEDLMAMLGEEPQAGAAGAGAGEASGAPMDAGFGAGMPAGPMAGGMDPMAGALPGGPSQELPSPADRDVLPLDNPEVKQALTEILAERAKERQRASEFFQEQARMMTRKTFG